MSANIKERNQLYKTLSFNTEQINWEEKTTPKVDEIISQWNDGLITINEMIVRLQKLVG